MNRSAMATVVLEDAPAASARSSVLTLVNSSIGAGILALPLAFSCTGWAGGLAAVAFIACTEGFTLYVLARCAESTGARTYGALVHRLLGRRTSLLMCLATWLFLYGSCCAYLMIIGDSFTPLLQHIFGHRWWTSRNLTITAVGCLAILPLTFRRSLGALAAVSSAAVSCILVVVGAIVFRSAQLVADEGDPFGHVKPFHASWDALGALPLIILGFACHTNVITVFTELEQQPIIIRTSLNAAVPGTAAAAGKAAACTAAGAAAALRPAGGSSGSWRRRQPKTAKLTGMVAVVALSVGLTAVLYSATGLMGYLAFPHPHPDILLNFGPEDKLMQVARAAIGLVLIASYPVVHFPARAAVRELLHYFTAGSRAGAALADGGGGRFAVVEALCFFGATLALALSCTDLGSVFEMVGGTCGSTLVLAVPGALLISYASQKAAESRRLLAQEPPSAGSLQQPLLGAAAAAAAEAAAEAAAAERGAGSCSLAGGALTQQPALPPQPYTVLLSKMFWAGVALQLMAAFVFVLTVWRALI